MMHLLDDNDKIPIMKLGSLIKICKTLENKGVRYLIVGGMAVIAHGYTRMTMDLDLVISLQEKNIKNALDVFSQMGYRPRVPVKLHDFADPVKRASWIREKNMTVFSLISDDIQLPPIDIFVSEPFDFDVEYSQAERYTMDDDTSVPVVSLSTLIKMKKEANREKDRLDISCLSHFLSEE